jgi:DNA-binding transcriptional MocR family regulator
VQAAELSKLCLKHGLILAPGNSFSQAEQSEQFMRFNVAQCIDKKVFDILQTAIQQLQNSSIENS